ncbi:MAG: sigma-70 family RNA polymerase sigma factor [Anaerolineales bacterium]|nr:sigma-70 family RNA polymerase sigma factor [Anaerolineales bacterium]
MRGLSYSLSSRTRGDIDALIEDFVQDALIKILANLDTFRGESKLTTWAQKIAIRVAFTELRRKRWQDAALEDLLPKDSGPDFTPAILTDTEASPEQLTSQQMIIETVMRVIKENLTERQHNAMMAIREACPWRSSPKGWAPTATPYTNSFTTPANGSSMNFWPKDSLSKISWEPSMQCKITSPYSVCELGVCKWY